MSTLDRRRHSTAEESAIFAGRLFLHWRRYPIVPLQSLLFPTVLLITYALLVGQSMKRVTGTAKLDLLIAICSIAGAMSGTLGAAFAITNDRNSGLTTRLWIMPVRRYSAIGGILLAEALRTLLGTVLITATGMLVGFQFHGNALAFVLFLLVPVAAVVAYGLIVVTIATSIETRALLTWLNTAMLGLIFATATPPDVVPAIARPIVKYQPLAAVVHSMQSLAQGQDATIPLLVTVAWLAVLVAIFGPLAIRGYRKAAETASKE